MAHEIMENDNMFSVGQTPWHGLGVVLNNPPTILEGLIAADLNWQVDALPLFCQSPVEHEGRRKAGGFKEVPSKAILRLDTKEVLGVVGPNWTPLQNAEAFKVFEPLVESKDLLLETAGSLKNGRRVWILARINADGAEISNGDEVRPYVLLSNSHDGTMAVRFGFTPVRVVCNNTLSAAEKENSSSRLIRVIHTPNLHDNLERLRSLLDLAKATFAATIEQYRWLANRDINQADLERYVKITFQPDFEDELAALDGGNEAIDMTLSPSQNQVIQLFESGIGSGTSKAKTWWGAYNAVNEWLMYHRGRSASNRLNSVWFADGYNLNRRALDTALRLAA